MRVRKWLGGLLLLAMVFTMAMGIVACGPTPNDQVTVTWYNGRNVLRTDYVDIGSTVEEWTPEREGYVFTGWYSESSLAMEFDFSKPIEKDTNIYSKWRSAVVQDDDRYWYAIGSIAGSNWLFLTEKNEDGVWEKKAGYDKFFFENKGDNTFELTLTLRPNTKFRFVTNLLDPSTWEGDEGRAEMGLGNLKGFAYADGKDPEPTDGGTYKASDMKYGEVKDADGKVVFYGGYEYNMPTNTWNIWPAEGSDGVYKFTVKTYPGYDEDNLIEWECVEKLDALESEYDMYIVGTVSGDHENWDTDYDRAVKLTRDSDDQTIWRAFVEITEAMYPSWSSAENPEKVPAASLKIANLVSGLDYGILDGSGTKGNANLFLTAGVWCITYQEGTDIVSYELCDYYVVGTITFGNTNYNFTVADGRITPNMTTEDDGVTYTAEIAVHNVASVAGYTWLANQTAADGKPAIFAVEVVFGSSLGIMSRYGTGESANGNLLFSEEGTYTVTLTVADGTISAEKTSDDKEIPEPVTVTYYEVDEYYFSTAIYEEELIKGDTAEWRPERRKGYRFDGWYLDEWCEIRYTDGDLAITKNTSLYCRFVPVDVDMDETVYYVTGSGLGDLQLGGNFTSIWKEHFALTRSETLDADGLTVYTTIDIKMYYGDQFKIVSDLSWVAGTHFGFLELRNPGDTFRNEGGVGNIGLQRGKDGIYRFTLHTDPYDYTQNYIEWELVGTLDSRVTEDMYIIGSRWGNWSSSPSQMLKMSVADDGITWSVTTYIGTKDEFKIYNTINSSYHPGGTGNNLMLKTFFEGPVDGYYTITWNADTDEITVSKAETSTANVATVAPTLVYCTRKDCE